ncbi:MAG TPA: peptide chain release factor-like protein [Bdellovibrionota bacterium]|nr:peptide chain release factor-like protein [Bdellovibrionota bacterium]
MVQIYERDLIVERLRRSGPGGQHRNRRETGIRITHLPTGIVVLATERRSQDLNLQAALKRLQEKLKARMRKPVPRIGTKPSRASRETRLRSKKKRTTKKSDRRKIRPGQDDD